MPNLVAKNVTVTRKPIQSASMSKADFIGKFRALNSAKAAAQKNHEIAEIPFKTWDGGQAVSARTGEDTFTNQDAKVTINFNKMSNVFDDSNCKYEGIADGAPVSYSENQGLNGDTVRVTMDTVKFAEAVHAEKAASGRYAGREKALEGSKGRLDLRYDYAQANSGVASMSADSMAKNIGKFAAQRYVLTATAKDPDAQKPSQALVSEIGKLYADEFNKFAQNLDKYGQNFKAQDGTEVADTAVKTDAFQLKAIGLEGIDKKGSPKGPVAYAIVDAAGNPVAPSQSSKANEWLRSVGERFQREISGTVNAAYADNKLAKSIANSVNVVPYAVNPQGADGVNKDYMLVQPSVQAKISPFANNFDKACQVANHDLDIDKAYAPEVVANAKDLYETYNGRTGLTQEQAKDLQGETLAKVDAALSVEGPQDQLQ